MCTVKSLQFPSLSPASASISTVSMSITRDHPHRCSLAARSGPAHYYDPILPMRRQALQEHTGRGGFMPRAPGCMVLSLWTGKGIWTAISTLENRWLQDQAREGW